MATIGPGLQKYLAGQSDLPESAAGHKQKPVDDFGWKPSDEETRRDIENDKKFAPIEREIFMESYRKRTEEPTQKPTRIAQEGRKGPKIGIGLSRLLQDVKGAVKDPIERLGAETRKQVKSLANFPEIGMDNLPKGPIDPAKGAELATDLLQTTPAGAVAGVVKDAGGPVVRSLLEKLTRKTRLAGEVKDPVAQELLQGKGLDNVIAGLEGQGLEKVNGVLGAGGSSVVLDTNLGALRLGLGTENAVIKSTHINQPITTGSVSGTRYEIFPKADTHGITMTDVRELSKQLAKEGLEFIDAGVDNVGRVAGKLVVIDPGAVQRIKQRIPDDWMGEKIAHELGDVTITRSAKFPDKVQVTYWSGKAGTSPTVGDEIFDSVEEAKAAVKQ